jgi:hypothetical protein
MKPKSGLAIKDRRKKPTQLRPLEFAKKATTKENINHEIKINSIQTPNILILYFTVFLPTECNGYQLQKKDIKKYSIRH